MIKKIALFLLIAGSFSVTANAGLCPAGEYSYCDGFGTCFCSA
ncbi:hypothetical protein [Shewanella sp. VB17]|nr:hypothetical protein [Shewanella sp. VB17]